MLSGMLESSFAFPEIIVQMSSNMADQYKNWDKQNFL